MSAIGLFDVKRTDGNQSFISDKHSLFDKITIKLNSDYYTGDTFIIEPGAIEKNIYIQSTVMKGADTTASIWIKLMLLTEHKNLLKIRQPNIELILLYKKQTQNIDLKMNNERFLNLTIKKNIV